MPVNFASVNERKLRAARDAEFAEALAMSRRMLSEAQAGRWVEVIGLQVERQQQLENFFAAPVPRESAERIATGIREMLELDREVMALGRKGMDALSGAMNGLRAGRRAQQAYGAVGA